jgi:winged helix DNA-binding protein
VTGDGRRERLPLASRRVDREQVVAFRVARQGLAERGSVPLAEAAACPASDFVRGSALLALAARSDAVTRERYDEAVDAGGLLLAGSLRGAIHALAPADIALFGRGLLTRDDDELAEQLGTGAQRHLSDVGVAAGEALNEIAAATAKALAGGRTLTKDELHEELRSRVREELLPWCEGCGSHHVSPMLWRYGAVQAGARLDSKRRYRMGKKGRVPARAAAEAARRFLRTYGPATAKDFGAWAGLARAHARRAWAELEDELVEVRPDGARVWLLREDEAALASPPQARGVRLLPPRDPYVQHPDRASVVEDVELRKKLFRPVANPGAVLQDGRIAGLWRARAKSKRTEIEVEELGRIDRDALQDEAERVAALRGTAGAIVRWS